MNSCGMNRHIDYKMLKRKGNGIGHIMGGHNTW